MVGVGKGEEYGPASLLGALPAVLALSDWPAAVGRSDSSMGVIVRAIFDIFMVGLSTGGFIDIFHQIHGWGFRGLERVHMEIYPEGSR